jgi:hypothetical protein
LPGKHAVEVFHLFYDGFGSVLVSGFYLQEPQTGLSETDETKIPTY